MTKNPIAAEASAEHLAEAAIREKLETVFGFALHKKRLHLGDGQEMEVDAANPEQRFYGEICARVGKLQPAQLENVAADILKLQYLEKKLGVPCRKVLGFADISWAKYFDGKSWLAAAVRTFDVKIVVVGLPEEVLLKIFAAQRQQKMVHPSRS